MVTAPIPDPAPSPVTSDQIMAIVDDTEASAKLQFTEPQSPPEPTFAAQTNPDAFAPLSGRPVEQQTHSHFERQSYVNPSSPAASEGRYHSGRKDIDRDDSSLRIRHPNFDDAAGSHSVGAAPSHNNTSAGFAASASLGVVSKGEAGGFLAGFSAPSEGATDATAANLVAAMGGRYAMLDTGLAGLALRSEQAMASRSALPADRSSLAGGIRSGAVTADGKYVVIDATARDGDGAALLAQLQKLGLQQGSSFAGMAGGLLPIARVNELAGVADLAFASQAMSMMHVGNATSQGDHAMLADTARATYGVDGAGVKVGVISDSFNAHGGMNTDKASDDLPAATTILLDYGLGTDEGRAMAQIVHDVAPGAAIAFSTAYSFQTSFANSIVNLANNGAKIIVDDVLYFAEPAYQDGIIAQAVNQVATNNGVVYLSAAANDGHNGFESAFIDTGISASFLGRTETFAQLSTTVGMTPFLSVTMPSGRGAFFILDWAQPSGAASPGKGATSDLDLFITNAAGTALSTIDHQTGLGEQPYAIANNIGNNPKEVVYFHNDELTAQTVNLAVGLHSGIAPAEFKIMVLDNGAGVTLAQSSLNVDDGTVYGHAAASKALAVGAANYAQTPPFGVTPPVIETYSSGGPTKIYYDAAGNLLATPEVRQTPAFTAPDGGATTVSGFTSFFGTSAAAPHAAAVAALMLQANPNLNADDIRNLLQDSATDMDNPATAGFDKGYDAGTGSGLIQANLAVGSAATGIIIADAAHLAIVGTHLDDTVKAGSGSHSLNGGAGNDTLDYSTVTGKITIDVAAGTAQDGASSFNDLFSGFEAFKGGTAADTFIGSANDDLLDGGKGNDTLNGGDGSDTLVGGEGNDTLNGGIGIDHMSGGAGNDTYYVDDAGDTVSEDFGAGTDKVNSTVSYALDVNIEKLTLIGVGNIDGAGNDLNNTIVGNIGDNMLSGGKGNDTLNGGDGNDTLVGEEGNDTLNGGIGIDHMSGGAGNDTYYVDDAGDTVSEDFGAGTDKVNSTISYALDVNIEKLTLIGVGNIDGAGNDRNNTIVGNIGDNVLSGGKGNDTLNGGDGNDTLVGGAGDDNLTGGLGSDTFDYNTLADAGKGKDVVTDFIKGVGNDVLDVHDVLSTFAGYDGTNAFSGGYLDFLTAGVNTVVRIDATGGADSYVTLVTLNNVDLTSVDTQNYVV